ncbi:hypothetical protein ABZ570_20460 [Micromonospora sp. NPDC007271]|uniref:hypothetical protein n=1 Tax=Micromonospora sp. NPDC007271 TaxID=3154587 RepID=UPI00340279B8
MTEVEVEDRDDRAWPKGAMPVSLLVGPAVVAAGITVTAASNHVALAAVCLLAGLVVGSSLIVIGIRRWLGGQAFPAACGMVSGLVAVGGMILTWKTGFVGAGGALLLGLGGGCLLANVWAIRSARRNRRR